MSFSYDINEVPQPELPSLHNNIQRAKMFLMNHSPESGDNLYDHLSELLTRILTERPKNAVDIFEEYSRQLKDQKLRVKSGLREFYVPPVGYNEAKQLIKLFQPSTSKDVNDSINEESKQVIPNLLELVYYLEQCDISLPMSDVILLNLSIRKLAKEQPIINLRFWGKILGRPKNYYVVEAELSEEELSRRLLQVYNTPSEVEEKLHEVDETNGKTDDKMSEEDDHANGSNVDVKENIELDLVFPSIPKSIWNPLPIVPVEQIGTGLNKMVYFVCNSPGLDEWIELASVTPGQIVAARQIVRCFTGYLETPIDTFPAFPGNEGNYLRAQIARISAATHVSPVGYYVLDKEVDEEFDDDEDDEETLGNELKVDIFVNENYEPLSVNALMDLSNWCHYRQYILEQGRTTFWDPTKKVVTEEELGEDEDDDDAANDEDDTINGSTKNAPPLLSPLSKDVLNDSMPVWTMRMSSEIQPDIAIAFIRSNVWPGAIAFAKDKNFDNVYIGPGYKYNSRSYCPPAMPMVQDQYKNGPEIMEMQDPSVEEEEAHRNSQLSHTKESESDEDESVGEEYETEDDD